MRDHQRHYTVGMIDWLIDSTTTASKQASKQWGGSILYSTDWFAYYNMCMHAHDFKDASFSSTLYFRPNARTTAANERNGNFLLSSSSSTVKLAYIPVGCTVQYEVSCSLLTSKVGTRDEIRDGSFHSNHRIIHHHPVQSHLIRRFSIQAT